MTSKEYLKQAFTAHKRIDALQEQIARHREDMTRVSRSAVQESVQASRQRDPMGDLVVRLLDKIEGCEKALSTQMNKLLDIEESIDEVDHELCREVLRARYIMKKDKFQIAKDMDYSAMYIKAILSQGAELIKVPPQYASDMSQICLEYTIATA